MLHLPNNLMTSPLLKNAGIFNQSISQQNNKKLDLTPPELNIPRVVQYYADYSGCGFWRMIWPEHLLNAFNHFTVHGSTVMNLDPRYFVNVKAVRIQRQATSHQLQFVKFLKEISKEVGFRIIYEIDDLIFSEDIPEYNKYKPAFTDPEIRKNCQDIMSLCDEITVTCPFMKEYYKGKTGHKNVTIIPNFPPKFWLGHFYDEKQISANYDTYKSKPRIMYAGSGAHFDVDNRVNQNDDFAHVIEAIASTVDKYQWVFLGAYPLPLRNLVQSGKIEFHPWANLYFYGEKIKNLRVNMMVAPLQDNNFNKSKSDLKLIEANAFGLPIACQDLCTYENAKFKFNTGKEMIAQIDDVLSKKGRYMNISAKARSDANKRWLENDDNIKCYQELFSLPYGHSDRKVLNAINGIIV
jgi:glycosyltransferase involved in cell wall biosynthesis